MVSDTDDRLPSPAPVDDPASAAMVDGPSSPPPPPSDGLGVPVADEPPPPPALLPATPVAVAHPAVRPVAPITTVVSSSVLQTIDIRRHVPVTLDLLAGNYAQWRRHFDTAIGMFGLRDHVDAEAVPRFDDPDWAMADHAVVHWLNTTVAPDLLDAVMAADDTALTVWTEINGIFRDNQLNRAVYIDAEYHAVVQGDLTIMQYCTKLKTYADQLRDLGQPVTEPRQVFHLLRGLNRQYHGAMLTSPRNLRSRRSSRRVPSSSLKNTALSRRHASRAHMPSLPAVAPRRHFPRPQLRPPRCLTPLVACVVAVAATAAVAMALAVRLRRSRRPASPACPLPRPAPTPGPGSFRRGPCPGAPPVPACSVLALGLRLNRPCTPLPCRPSSSVTATVATLLLGTFPATLHRLLVRPNSPSTWPLSRLRFTAPRQGRRPPAAPTGTWTPARPPT
ncbi:hypothetical protein VPH35_131853 [Triticum aestivum]